MPKFCLAPSLCMSVYAWLPYTQTELLQGGTDASSSGGDTSDEEHTNPALQALAAQLLHLSEPLPRQAQAPIPTAPHSDPVTSCL